jgi:excisionase family DNA binding protein
MQSSDNRERMRTWESDGPRPLVKTMTDRKTISIMKACETVGVSRRTIYNWIASGKVEYVRTAGGSVRIFVDTLWRQPHRAPDLTNKEAS